MWDDARWSGVCCCCVRWFGQGGGAARVGWIRWRRVEGAVCIAGDSSEFKSSGKSASKRPSRCTNSSILSFPPPSLPQKVDMYSLGVMFFEMSYRPLVTGMERVKVLSELRTSSVVIPSDFDESERANQVSASFSQSDARIQTSAKTQVEAVGSCHKA